MRKVFVIAIAYPLIALCLFCVWNRILEILPSELQSQNLWVQSSFLSEIRNDLPVQFQSNLFQVLIAMVAVTLQTLQMSELKSNIKSFAVICEVFTKHFEPQNKMHGRVISNSFWAFGSLNYYWCLYFSPCAIISVTLGRSLRRYSHHLFC